MKYLSKNQINYIYHLADIHIRPLERHNEYREVFNNLYEYLKIQNNLKESLIVICGDIIHEKDKLTPELIILFREFINTLSSFTDVILFSGNHDLIENNKNRRPNLDALTVDLDNKKIFYLKKSGLYKYGNIIFSLVSLEDKGNIIKYENNDKIKIALYHGMLKEVEHSKESISENDFSDFDYTLLGDIHERRFFTEKKNIAYPGSLIQQNFGESHENHGLIKWDLIKKIGEEVDIKNNYGYITITDNFNLENLPENLRLRFYTTKNVDELKNKIKQMKKTIISEKIIPFESNNDIITYEKAFLENIDDEEIIKIKLPNNYQEIIKLHNEIKNECNFDLNKISEYQWYLKKLTFKNLFIYGENKVNEIIFDNKNGIIGILGNNAIGKSTIINIIIFALFDKISSEYHNSNVVNKNCKFMEVTIEFRIGNINYIIHKKGYTHKTKSYEINFKKIENNKEINMNGTDKRFTQKNIDKILGSRDNFILCNVISNVNMMSILQMKPSELNKTLQTLLNLDKYNLLHDNISNKLKELNKLIDNNEGKSSLFKNIKDDDLSKIELELNNKIDNKNKYINELDIQSKELKKINKVINNLSKQINIIEKPNENEDTLLLNEKEIKRKVDNNIIIEFNIEELYLKLYNINNDKNLEDLKKEFSKLNKCNKQYRKENLVEKTILLNNIKSNLKDYKIQINKYENNNNIKNKNNNTLNELYELKNKIIFKEEGIKKDIIKVDNKKIKGLENKLKSNKEILHFNLKNIGNEKNKLKKIIKKKDYFNKDNNLYKIDETNNLLIKIDLFLDNIKNNEEISKIQNEIELINKSLTGLQNQKKINEDNKLYNKTVTENIKYNKSKKKEYEELEKLISKLNYQDYSNKIINCEKDINIYEKEIEYINESINYNNLKDIIEKIESNNKIKFQIEQLKYKKDLDEIQNKLLKYKNYKENYQENIKLQKEKELHENNKIEIELKIKKLNKNITTYETEIRYETKNINDIKHKLKDKCKIEQLLKELNERKILYETYRKIVDKKCLPNELLKKKIEYIKKDINIHLEDLVNFKIDIYIESDKIEIDILKNDCTLKPYMCSGYEKFILNIMIKHTLNRYCYTNKSNLFCIDEGLDCIDDNNIKKFNIVLERLRKTYNHIILISQIDRINEYIDHNICIENNSNSSYIKD
jgi:DNA repair exonuclease SbcCD ATPase subunit